MKSKHDLLFYDAYESFYAMAERSEAFRLFCLDAFGADFSQDGFSNIDQIDMILPHIPRRENVHILDIGCGNGKMLGYLQEKTGAYIHGFDYSEAAIRTAKALFPEKADFCVGVMGGIDYPAGTFDVVIAMDTLYFAPDMTAFIAQVKRWLKQDGVFLVGYQEGDVTPRTAHAHTTLLARALCANGMPYDVTDITRQSYDLLKQKRQFALKHRDLFQSEGHSQWFEMLMGQTEYASVSFSHFRERMARYIYVIRR